MGTGESLSAPEGVRRLQKALHEKAKESPDLRFYSLSDKVWRADVLQAAWQAVRRNGGAAGVDGETVQRIEAQGLSGWLGELARDLKDGTYRPGAVRQVLIPKKQAGKYRPLGIPCVRDRVAQTAVLLVLTPIFEADLQPEQYAYREGCSAQDAVKRVHRLLNRGHQEVVDADLSNYFGEIPHAELMRSVARRVSDGRLLGWIKAWLEMPVEEDDGGGGTRRTNRARRERKGTPQGAPVSPLISNIYMRRFIVGWKVLGYARRFDAAIVNYLLRSERRQCRALVPRQPVVPAAGVAATRDGATRRRHWNLARPARLQMKEMTAMSRGGILRAGHSLPLRGFFGDYGVVVEHRMRDAWRGLP